MFHCIPIDLLALIKYFGPYAGLRKLRACGTIHDHARKIMHVIFIFKNLVNEENLDESQKKEMWKKYSLVVNTK